MTGILTVQEVEALAQLLARIPASGAEALWANGVLDRLRMLAKVAATQTQDGGGGSPPETP